jgi:hypothetical protein
VQNTSFLLRIVDLLHLQTGAWDPKPEIRTPLCYTRNQRK